MIFLLTGLPLEVSRWVWVRYIHFTLNLVRGNLNVTVMVTQNANSRKDEEAFQRLYFIYSESAECLYMLTDRNW